MKLPNGMNTERPIIGADWSRKKGVDIYDPHTDSVANFPSFEAAAPNYKGYLLITESTAESFELQRRAVVLKAFEENNVEAWGFKTQRTAQFRMKWDILKSNESDAKTIYCIGTKTKTALSRLGPLRTEDLLREEIQETLVRDRFLFDGEPSQKLAAAVLNDAVIPREFSSILVEKEFKKKRGRVYRSSVGRILLVAKAVRDAGRGYREFRRQLGNYGNGYKSMARSEHNWHLTIYEVRRALKKAGITKTTKAVKDPKTGIEISVRVWTDEELHIKSQVQKTVVAAAKFLWQVSKEIA
ncbi:Uncharacterised protein [uncultured archaeon]|nr:Uncharacterised protein [uncultured archaeon]